MNDSISKSVVLTGASGFIGRNCIPHLLAKGYEVHCVSTRPQQSMQKNVHWHEVNLLESSQVQSLISSVKPEYLLHLAWYVEPGKVINDPSNMLWVEKSLELLRAFHEHGGKRVTVSGSCYEYDWNHGYCSEKHTPTTSDTFYGISKNCYNQLLSQFCKVTGLSGAWGRLFFLYGPYENKSRLVSSVILSLLANEPAKSSHGRQIRDYMHASDVAAGLVMLLDSELQGDYNLSTGDPVTLRDILLTIGDIMGKSDLLDIGAIPARANDTPLVVGDPRKFQELSGWKPGYDLREGLSHTIEWWKNEISQ